MTFSPLLDPNTHHILSCQKISDPLFSHSFYINCFSGKQSSERQRGRCCSCNTIKRKIPFFISKGWITVQDKTRIAAWARRKTRRCLLIKNGTFWNPCELTVLSPIWHRPRQCSYLILYFSPLQVRFSAARVSCCPSGWDTRSRPRWRASPRCRAAPAGGRAASRRRSTSSTWERTLPIDCAAPRQK